jgi:hypothetical protein
MNVTMRPSSLLPLLLVLLVLLVPPAAGQDKKGEFLLPIPEKLERATTTDEQGLQQWAEWKAQPCVNCKGRKTMTCQHCLRFEEGEDCPECKKTRAATCRVCAGSGEQVDVLKSAPCPSCFGAALTRCFVCNGAGRFPVTGGGDKPAKCGCCDAVGAYKCSTCDGKRLVEAPAFKPSLNDAKAQDLKKALEAVEATLAALAKFESTGDGRKDVKEHEKVTAAGARHLPPLKRAQKHFEEVSKRQAKGAVWTAYGDMVKSQAAAAKQAMEYYLKHQKRVLELCLARAEHNEPLLAQKKK